MALKPEVERSLQALLAAPKNSATFFDRERELNRVLELVKIRDRRVVILIGPNDTGKSALLKRVVELWDKDENLKRWLPVFHFDFRNSEYTTPDAAARSMKEQLQTWVDWVLRVLKGFKVTVGGVSLDLKEMVSQSGDNMASVLHCFRRLAYGDTDVRPIFIIAEADRMKHWPHTDLDTFFGFIKMITKQDNRAQVILASSDKFFRSWFKNHMNISTWEVIGIGCFNEGDAKTFFSHRVLQLVKAGAVPFDMNQLDWDKVFGVCGGNPLLLINCASDLCASGLSLDTHLDKVLAYGMDVVQNATQATVQNEGWDGENYRKIMNLICRKNGSVSLQRVLIEAFDKDATACRSQLLAMVKNNVIHVRFAPPGVVYDDIQNTSKCRELIMARSPAEFAAMKEFLVMEAESGAEAEEEAEEERKANEDRNMEAVSQAAAAQNI